MLSPPALKRLRDHFATEAATIVDALISMKRFDGVADLAEAFPLRVFPDAMGIRSQDRPKLLAHANLLFNSFGPRNELFQAARAKVGSLEWIEALGHRENLTPDSLGMMIHEAAHRGEIGHTEAPILVRALLQAGLDTTINALLRIVGDVERRFNNTVRGLARLPLEIEPA